MASVRELTLKEGVKRDKGTYEQDVVFEGNTAWLLAANSNPSST